MLIDIPDRHFDAFKDIIGHFLTLYHSIAKPEHQDCIQYLKEQFEWWKHQKPIEHQNIFKDFDDKELYTLHFLTMIINVDKLPVTSNKSNLIETMGSIMRDLKAEMNRRCT